MKSILPAGAELCATAEEIWQKSDMLIKVKEPQAQEFPLMREGQILYTYLHLAAEEELTKQMLARNIKGVAYETVEPDDHSLPLLRPMSEIAGRMSIQEGSTVSRATSGWTRGIARWRPQRREGTGSDSGRGRRRYPRCQDGSRPRCGCDDPRC
jgi:alanine dehydrogenase